ncbi:MAG: RNA-binding protein [Flavobacteriales bacterium]|nr:RNA-binding protein [Flavobacteriales bacterium]
MRMTIYVGRLNHAITELHLELLFGHFGEVERTKVVTDRITGEPRGFGFVEMKDKRSANKAIDKLDGVKLEGAILLVRPAHPSAVS